MTDKIVPVIMAGGKGTRLWPLSRATAAKQFLKVVGEETLFQSTLQRVSDTSLYEAPLVVTNEEFRFLVAEQAREQGVALSGILLEPVARNTAAAIAVAARVVAERFGPDAALLVLASDHAITVDAVYLASITAAATAARSGKLVTFGITPQNRPPAMAISNWVPISVTAPMPSAVSLKSRMRKGASPDRCRKLLLELRHVPVLRDKYHR